jgi:hypothetical protein
MPTTRPRHTITETDEVTRALDEAAAHWPEAAGARGRLLLHLVEEGRRAIRAKSREAAAQRRAAIQRTSGALTGAYGAGYLSRLRDDWPE